MANLLDELLLRLGSPGKLQVIIFIILCTNAYPITFNFIYITFFANVPPYTCKVNGTGFNDEWIPATSSGNNRGYSKCSMYANPINHSEGTHNCNEGYYFDTIGMERTIAGQWDLTCKNEYMASLASTIFFAGVMIGGLIFGSIADKVGRRPVVLGTLYGQAILGVASSFSNSYVLFVILKFCQGTLLQGLQASNNSLVMELFPLRYRTMAGMILSMCATSAHMIMSLLLYLLPDWRNMQLAISLLTVVSVFYSWLYPESIRWLLSQNKHDRAAVLVKRFAAVNNVELHGDIDHQLKKISQDINTKAQTTKNYDFRDLFRTKTIRIYTIVLVVSWFSASVTYYGIQFYIPKMKGREYRYLNLFISGAMETVARGVGYFIIERFGRRKPLMVFYIMSGLLCIATGIIADTVKSVDVAANVLAIIGKLCSAQCFAFIMVYSSEIFPTVVRTVGLGFVACFTRIGTMLAPQILDLRNVASISLPFVIFGSSSIISAILLFFLPETLGKPLPNNIDDVDRIQTGGSPMTPATNTNDYRTTNFSLSENEANVDGLAAKGSKIENDVEDAAQKHAIAKDAGLANQSFQSDVA